MESTLMIEQAKQLLGFQSSEPKTWMLDSTFAIAWSPSRIMVIGQSSGARLEGLYEITRRPFSTYPSRRYPRESIWMKAKNWISVKRAPWERCTENHSKART